MRVIYEQILVSGCESQTSQVPLSSVAAFSALPQAAAAALARGSLPSDGRQVASPKRRFPATELGIFKAWAQTSAGGFPVRHRQAPFSAADVRADASENSTLNCREATLKPTRRKRAATSRTCRRVFRVGGGGWGKRVWRLQKWPWFSIIRLAPILWL
jgi:hypothetical protein